MATTLAFVSNRATNVTTQGLVMPTPRWGAALKCRVLMRGVAQCLRRRSGVK